MLPRWPRHDIRLAWQGELSCGWALLSAAGESLHAAAGVGRRRGRRRRHQPETLKQEDRALRRSPPDKLATFALAVLHVDVAARILKAAILEGTVDEHPVVQNEVLVLKDFVFVSSHVNAFGDGRSVRHNTRRLALRAAEMQ